MAITYGFFNSVDGDRKYNAEQMSTYFDGLVSDGIFQSVGKKFSVTAGVGLTVNVDTGRALIECHWLKNDNVLTISLDNADVQNDRKDLIVIKLDYTARTMGIEYIKGAEVARNTETVKYLTLARITVPAGATAITQANIKDNRGSALCPWVTGLVKQVDTADLFSQYEKAYEEMVQEMITWWADRRNAFDTWFNNLTSTLNVNLNLTKQEFSYTTTAETDIIPLVSDYQTTDILLIHVNGVLFVEGTEYSIESGNIKLAKTITAGNTVTQILIKSVIGGDVVTSGTMTLNLYGNSTDLSGKMEVAE